MLCICLCLFRLFISDYVIRRYCNDDISLVTASLFIRGGTSLSITEIAHVTEAETES